MTFDPQSLLHAPPMTVSALADALANIVKTGMGEAEIKLPGGQGVNNIVLVAHGEQAAHFVIKGK